MSSNPSPVPGAGARFVATLGAVILFVAVIRWGWASDDSFIAIRSVDHFVGGKGLVLNVGQRVQSFTSPLWTLLCIPVFAITRDPYWTLVGLGLVATAALGVVLIRAFRAEPWRAVVVLLALCASIPFLQFSTSGLENSLAHWLAAAFVIERTQSSGRATRAGFVLAALLFLTRFDYVLLAAPAVVLAILEARGRTVKLARLGFALASVWLVFATVYYGFPLPNTAYAKLNTAIPATERIPQGLVYLFDSATRDPIVLSAIVAATFLALRRGVPMVTRAVMLGVLLYVAYVVDVGGDFMAGRFLTTPFLVSVLVLVELVGPLHAWALPAAAATLVPFLQLRADVRVVPAGVPASGIVDEWDFYTNNTGVNVNIRGREWLRHAYLDDFRKAASGPERVIAYGTAGLALYANVDEKHVVEGFALTEPLLARLRFRPKGKYRVGHYAREIPPGYLEALRTGHNGIADPCIHGLFDRLQLVTTGPIWRASRFKAIWDLNTFHGGCDPR